MAHRTAFVFLKIYHYKTEKNTKKNIVYERTMSPQREENKPRRKINGDVVTFDHGSAVIEFFKQSREARNRVGIGLSYQPASLNRLAELIPWSRFLGSLKV